MITEDEIRRVEKNMAEFNLHQEETTADEFISRVRAAHHWATTHRNRWRHFRLGHLGALRHHCEYDLKRGIGDKAFATAVDLAGWHPYREWLRPHILRFRRAKAEA